MLQQTPNRLPKAGHGRCFFNMIVQWNGGCLLQTYEELLAICERVMSDRARGTGPSFSDRMVEWNGGVLPVTFDDVVAICKRVNIGHPWRLVPVGECSADEGRRTGRVSGVACEKCEKVRPGLRHVYARITQSTADKRSLPSGLHPVPDLESRYHSLPHAPSCPPHKPIPSPPSPSVHKHPTLSTGRARPPLLIPDGGVAKQDEVFDWELLDEFLHEASDVLDGYAFLSRSNEKDSAASGLDDSNGEPSPGAFEQMWNPLEETDRTILALRAAEVMEGAARDREKRTRRMVMERRAIRSESDGRGRSRSWRNT